MIITTRGGGVVAVTEQTPDNKFSVNLVPPLYAAASTCGLLGLPPYAIVEALLLDPSASVAALHDWLRSSYSEPYPTCVVGLGIHGHCGAALAVITGDTAFETLYHGLDGGGEKFTVTADGALTTLEFAAPSTTAAHQVLRRLSILVPDLRVCVREEGGDGGRGCEELLARDLPRVFPPPDIG